MQPFPTEAVLDDIADYLRTVYQGRRWVVGTDALVAASRTADRLLYYGATDALAIAASRGTGTISDRHPHAHLNLSGGSIMAGIRAAEQALISDPTLRAAVDTFDPEHEAQAIGAMFCSTDKIAGRPVFAGRPASWRALEDKTTVDALWDAVGVPRAPALIVPATADALLRAAGQLDLGDGTVWAGDSRQGFHGAAEYLRWVRTPEHADAAAQFFAAECDQVRVMPFLEGIPCSIHGLVLPDTVLALRPCEMVVFRTPGSARLTYARAATFWEPHPDDAAELRDHARRTGAHLRDTLGYRGVFTIDGVMTRDGFRPTELNPRYGAALAVLTSALPQLDTYLLHLAIVSGAPLPFDPALIEQLILHASATERRGGASAVFRTPPATPQTFRLCRHPAWRFAADDEPADATGMIGPSPAGGYLSIDLDPARTPIGPPTAPDVVGALAVVDDRFGLGLGRLEAARGVR